MAWRLKKPLITVPGHDDLTASYPGDASWCRGVETVWVDEPLAQAAGAAHEYSIEDTCRACTGR